MTGEQSLAKDRLCLSQLEQCFSLGTTNAYFAAGFQSGPNPSAIFVRYDPDVSVTKMPFAGAAPKHARNSSTRVPSGEPFGTPSIQLGCTGKERSISGLPGYHAPLETA